MGIRLPSSLLTAAKQILKMQLGFVKKQSDVVPRGHVAVYVGDTQRKRFVVPVSYLNHPSFQQLLNRGEEEFGYHHPHGGLTIPCKEGAFIDLTSRLQHS
ncbi:auxin-responsive protein SAUR24-like [Cucurbita moschata]|uniref:Auxin-responsive protein SAUR24-like n=1 Tax=Cucurbita moschata TaxID=3662 RepID=A0A6J1FVH8_CUCMO|nr:auxin-responsive protein SAUR24-like [Cucurbita moschata]